MSIDLSNLEKILIDHHKQFNIDNYNLIQSLNNYLKLDNYEKIDIIYFTDRGLNLIIVDKINDRIKLKVIKFNDLKNIIF